MNKNRYSFILSLVFIFTVLTGGQILAQVEVDDPNLDRIPKWYLDQIQNQQRQASEVITINDYDNFYLGVDFAEGHISVNPMEPTQFFTAYNIDDSHYTMDGHNWENSNPTWNANMRGDPLTAYDSLGNLYYENMYGSSIQGCKVVKSTDNGQTWSSAVTAISGNDKNWMCADQTAGPYANSVYTVMTNSGSGNFARSTDFGATWQTTFSPSTQSLPGMMCAVGAYQNVQGGAVYVVTNSGSSFASTYTFYRSLDGGSTFTQMSAQQFAGYVGRDVSGRNSVENMRTRPYPFIAADNSFGPNRGRLHLVYASNDPPGNGNKPDIWARYSDDGGATWSNEKRVNTGFFPTQSHQWQPAIWCDKDNGKLYVQWMDSRDTPTNDSAMIYATYSDDGGETFLPSQRISNEKMKINCTTCGGGGTPRYQGDYSGIVSNPDVSMATWSDFRWGSFATFTTYFPDFAMRVYPTAKEISYKDTLWAVVPDVKLYDNEAIFTATMEDPGTGTFTIEYPMGNSLTVFPDSIPIVVIADGVPVGSYAMEVKGEGPNGTPVHFREATINVIPLAPPMAGFSVSDTTTCLGTGINFIDESINAPSSWLWTFEGGTPATSTAQHPLGIVYDAEGSYDVSLEVSNSSGSNTITKTDFIVVNVLPQEPTGDPMMACVNEEIPPLEVNGVGITWYDSPDLIEVVGYGNIFETSDTLAGAYTYYATQTQNDCESPALEITLTIYDTPAVSMMPVDTLCLNAESFTLENGLPEGGTYFGAGVVDGMFDAAVAGEGVHMLGYTYADEHSCADTAYTDVVVVGLPEVSQEAFNPVCLDAEAFALTGGLPEGGVYSGVGVMDNMFDPEVAGEGEHEITYTIMGDFCNNAATQMLVVNALPEVVLGNDTTICGNQTITLDATTDNAASYLWMPGGQTTATVNIDSLGIGLGDEEIGVLVTDNNGCVGGDALILSFIDCTDIEDIIGLESVQIYPNPNDGSFNFNVTSFKSITVNLGVYDAMGVKHMEIKDVVIDGAYNKRIMLQDISPGLYFVTLENKDGNFIKKFLVE